MVPPGFGSGKSVFPSAAYDPYFSIGFRTTISDEQREEFGHLVQDSIRRIEAAEFLPHSGIRFPQNPCTSCPYIGLCLGRLDLTEATLVRRPGADDLGWLDELTY